MKCTNVAFSVVPRIGAGDAENCEFDIVFCFGISLAPYVVFSTWIYLQHIAWLVESDHPKWLSVRLSVRSSIWHCMCSQIFSSIILVDVPVTIHHQRYHPYISPWPTRRLYEQWDTSTVVKDKGEYYYSSAVWHNKRRQAYRCMDT